jgi:4-hydroxybenzoate polyprenyltransferase
MSSATDAPAPRRGFDLVAYLKLFRFPLVFTAIADSAAGYLIFHRPFYEPWVLPLLAIASAGLYMFGMGLNDLADLARDREIAPNRVLPSGRISPASARTAVIVALAISFEAMIWLGMTGYGEQVLFPWGLAVLSICAYDLGWAKVPPVMGLVRISNFMIGVSVATGIGYRAWVEAPLGYLPLALPTFVYITGLTYVSTLEDRETSRRRVWIGAGVMAFGALMASSVHPPTENLYYLPEIGRMVRGTIVPGRSVPAMLVSLILSAWILRRALAARDRKGIMLMVRDGIAGIILLDTALLLCNRRELEVAAGIAGLLIPAAVSVAVFKKLA